MQKVTVRDMTEKEIKIMLAKVEKGGILKLCQTIHQ